MTANTSIWPNSRNCAVLITVNLDAESVDLHEAKRENLYGRYSYGRYGMRAGASRLLDVFRAHAINATFFVPALDAENNRAVIDSILEDGHEDGARGYAYEDHSRLGPLQRATLEHAHTVLTKITGAKPVGWRAPFGLLSTETFQHLADLGYRYDSSFQDDDYPYVVDCGGGRQLVELPTFEALTDATFYNARHSHSRVLKVWKEEFDAMYSAGHCVNVTLHPRGDYGSGRAIRARVVDEFITYMARHPGVYFTTGRELASWWAGEHPQSEPVGANLVPFDAALARG